MVNAIASGEIQLDEIEAEALPEALKPMAPAEQSVYLAGLAQQRGELQQKIRDLSEDRDGYLAKKVEEAGGLEDSLDRQLYEAVKAQAEKAGLEYDDGPKY